MLFNRLRFLPVLLLFILFPLSACDSAEERAEKHFESGMELLETGDIPRALVEFRNVFQLDGQHREARQVYARVQREQGELAEAFGQYLRLVEQYPDDLEGRRALAEMAFASNNWEEVERHTNAGLEHHPDDEALKALALVLEYRQSALDEDNSAKDGLARRARDRLEVAPDDKVTRRLLINHLMTGITPLDALPEVNAALEYQPEDFALNVMKLQLLELQGFDAETEAQLQTMLEFFPGNQQVQSTVIAWHLNREDLDGAEAFLRQQAQASDDPAHNLTVVQFLRQVRSPEAAMAELDSLITAHPDVRQFRSVKAAMLFDTGEREAALADFEALLKDAEPSDENRAIKVALARALIATGDNVGARARVEEVLAEDPSQVEALKLRASWLVEDDKPGEAILALRRALDQSPRDASILTLMAAAHERDGSRDLAGERLAVAVEMSNSAPAESLRYARFLSADDRYLPAESVLIDALRLAPTNLRLLEALAGVYFNLKDWSRANGVVQRLRRIEDPAAAPLADRLQTSLLQRQEKTDETVAFLQGLINNGEADIGTKAQIVRTHIRTGNTDTAATYLDEELAEDPGNPALRHLRAGVHIMEGENDAGEAIYRALIAENPRNLTSTRALYSLLRGDRDEEAGAVLDAAIEANPGAASLRVIKALRLEKSGDVDAAIAIYEELYDRFPNNSVFANNLSSLITAHHDDDESLERSFAIAKRLRGSEVPAFQDTYGWIAYRRGDYQEALSHLEPAARGLPNDPLVQYHLGLTYRALERPEDAKEALERALGIETAAALPQMVHAQEVLDGIGR